MTNKTHNVSEAFCVNCHNYKGDIDKLLKQITEQQISINKLEKEINKMQPNINNLHEKITELKSDTEITKSKKFSYENISQNKEMFKSATEFEADDVQALLNFLTLGLIARISDFMTVEITTSLKVVLKMLNLGKRQSS